MRLTILLLVIFAQVFGEQYSDRHIQEENRRISTSYATSIIHGEPKDGQGAAQSSVKVHFNSAQELQNQLIPQQASTDSSFAYVQKPDAIKQVIQGVVYPYQAQSHGQSDNYQYQMKPAVGQESAYQYQIVQPVHDNTATYQNQVSDVASYMQYAKMKDVGRVSSPLHIQENSYANLQSLQTSLGQYQNGDLSPDARSFSQYTDTNQQLPQALPLKAQIKQDTQPKIPSTNSDSQVYLQYSGTKQVDSYSNPSEPQQLYNVGYSINIENVTPRLMYRVPNPPPINSFRQQKLLNADVITGTHKDKVEKPVGLTQSINNLDSSHINLLTSNYLQDQGKVPQIATHQSDRQQQLTRVYSDVTNTHGYTWKTLSPGVEISGYHNLEQPVSTQQQVQAQHFDHAAALGRSQGFDISNVVESGTSHSHSPTATNTQEFSSKVTPAENIQYQQPMTTFPKPTYDTINLQTKYKAQPFRQSHSLNIPHTLNQGNLHYSSTTNSLQTAQPILQDSNSLSKDALNFQQSDIQVLNIPSLQHSFGTGSNIDFDKSLLDGFYKNYNPSFFLSEITLPTPMISPAINLGAGQHTFGKYNSVQLPRKSIQLPLQNGYYQQLSRAVDPQLMVNQHYAFVQAEGMNHQVPSVSLGQQQYSDVKPVQELPHEQQAQQSNRHEVVQKVPKENNHKPDEIEKNNERKKTKFVVSQSPYRQRNHALLDKEYNLQRKLRPPPMIIIHQKY